MNAIHGVSRTTSPFWLANLWNWILSTTKLSTISSSCFRILSIIQHFQNSKIVRSKNSTTKLTWKWSWSIMVFVSLILVWMEMFQDKNLITSNNGRCTPASRYVKTLQLLIIQHNFKKMSERFVAVTLVILMPSMHLVFYVYLPTRVVRLWHQGIKCASIRIRRFVSIGDSYL
jgi:Na+/proline symporter